MFLLGGLLNAGPYCETVCSNTENRKNKVAKQIIEQNHGIINNK